MSKYIGFYLDKFNDIQNQTYNILDSLLDWYSTDKDYTVFKLKDNQTVQYLSEYNEFLDDLLLVEDFNIYETDDYVVQNLDTSEYNFSYINENEYIISMSNIPTSHLDYYKTGYLLRFDVNISGYDYFEWFVVHSIENDYIEIKKITNNTIDEFEFEDIVGIDIYYKETFLSNNFLITDDSDIYNKIEENSLRENDRLKFTYNDSIYSYSLKSFYNYSYDSKNYSLLVFKNNFIDSYESGDVIEFSLYQNDSNIITPKSVNRTLTKIPSLNIFSYIDNHKNYLLEMLGNKLVLSKNSFLNINLNNSIHEYFVYNKIDVGVYEKGNESLNYSDLNEGYYKVYAKLILTNSKNYTKFDIDIKILQQGETDSENYTQIGGFYVNSEGFIEKNTIWDIKQTNKNAEYMNSLFRYNKIFNEGSFFYFYDEVNKFTFNTINENVNSNLRSEYKQLDKNKIKLIFSNLDIKRVYLRSERFNGNIYIYFLENVNDNLIEVKYSNDDLSFINNGFNIVYEV